MKPTKGFTLFELFITLSIAGLLFGVGTPSLMRLHAKMQSTTLKHDIQQALNAGRNYSISRKQDVTVCGISHDGQCIRHNFKNIAVFVDSNANQHIDSDENVFSITELNYSDSLRLQASLGRRYIRFNRTGSAQAAGSFIYCHRQHPQASARITISMPGRSYLGRDLDNDGIVETVSGEPIRCS